MSRLEIVRIESEILQGVCICVCVCAVVIFNLRLFPFSYGKFQHKCRRRVPVPSASLSCTNYQLMANLLSFKPPVSPCPSYVEANSRH